jgi:phosphatidylglycerol:prolipoprotein diacylglycerol transferase
MLIHPQFDPVALRLGPVSVHWYGLCYVAAFASFFWLATQRLKHAAYARSGWSSRDVEDLLFFGVCGVILGGRLGYVLFYKPAYYASNPWEIIQVWKGGMAFHGGLIGVIVAMWLFARFRERGFFEVTDLIAPCVPVGLAFGRLGNFINGELWGRVAQASLPWAMVFPQSGTNLPRHPSQLYQFTLEGLTLFAMMWVYSRSPRPVGAVSGLFLTGYGVFRFAAEYFREPDDFLGALALGMSMGQWLSVPMVVSGAWLLARSQPKRPTDGR